RTSGDLSKFLRRTCSPGLPRAEGRAAIPARPSRSDEGVTDVCVVVSTYEEDKEQLEAKARAAVIPIVTGTPGYIFYGVMFVDDPVVSIRQWESEEHAKGADAALLEWVSADTTMKPVTRFTGDLSWLELAR